MTLARRSIVLAGAISRNETTLLCERLRALVELHDSRPLRVRMRQTNLQRVEGYLIDTCAARYEELFERALRNRAVARGAI